MNGAFKGLDQSDVYLTSYISKKQWQVTSESFENLGISKIEAASGSSTYGSYRMSYYEGSMPDSGSFSGSYDLNLQSTITLQGGRRLPQNIQAYSIPQDCFGENIEPGTVTVWGETCKIYDREGLLLLDTAASLPVDKLTILESGSLDEVSVSMVTEQLDTVAGRAYILEIKVPEGTWEGVTDRDCLIFIGAEVLDPQTEFTGEYLQEQVGNTLTITLRSSQPKVQMTWIEGIQDAGTELCYTIQSLDEDKVQVVGDIVYTQGLILLNADKISPAVTSIDWTSDVTINTWNVRCVVKDLECNYSYNSSVSGSNAELMGTSEFTPYITAVGLYNRAGELMAVAKLSKPIRKNDNIDMTFKVNIDIS